MKIKGFSPSRLFGIVASKCDLTRNFVVGDLDRKLASVGDFLEGKL